MTAEVMHATGQLAAARVLVGLLEHGDLPPVGWNVCGIRPGDLNGQIGRHSGDLAARVGTLSMYAGLLATPVTLHRYALNEGGALHTHGALHEVAVHVWTAVDADELAVLDTTRFAESLGIRGTCRCGRTEMFALPGVPLTAPPVCTLCAPGDRS